MAELMCGYGMPAPIRRENVEQTFRHNDSGIAPYSAKGKCVRSAAIDDSHTRNWQSSTRAELFEESAIWRAPAALFW